MTELVQASTIACSSSAMLEQHGSTRSSGLARHVEPVESYQDMTSQVEFGLYSAMRFCHSHCHVAGMASNSDFGVINMFACVCVTD